MLLCYRSGSEDPKILAGPGITSSIRILLQITDGYSSENYTVLFREKLGTGNKWASKERYRDVKLLNRYL
jgi:hypothetical protein